MNSKWSISILPAEPFFRLLDFGVLEKDSADSQVKSLSSMRGTLLGYSFKPRTNRRVLATLGSVLDHRCVNEPMLALGKEKPFDDIKQGWLVVKFELRRPQRLTRFRQSLLLSSSLKKTKEGSVFFLQGNHAHLQILGFILQCSFHWEFHNLQIIFTF